MLFKSIITEPQILLDLINSNISCDTPLLVTYINQHSFNVYCSNLEYKNLIDNSFKIYADGIGMNLTSRFLFNNKYNQFNATDLNERILNHLIEKNIKFFILGGSFDQEQLNKKFYSLKNFVGYQNGFFSDFNFMEITKSIEDSKAEVVIIGMGVPMQEIVAKQLSQSIDASIFLCVGNFFEFYLGTIKRIPLKYRDKGFEWLFRIIQEPKRLWKRYFIGIPLFIFRVIKFKFMNTKTG